MRSRLRGGRCERDEIQGMHQGHLSNCIELHIDGRLAACGWGVFMIRCKKSISVPLTTMIKLRIAFWLKE